MLYGTLCRTHTQLRSCRELIQEQKAEKVLFRSTFGTQRKGLRTSPMWRVKMGMIAGFQRLCDAASNAFDLVLKNPANTSALFWGGRLLALWEVCSFPVLFPEHTQCATQASLACGMLPTGCNFLATVQCLYMMLHCLDNGAFLRACRHMLCALSHPGHDATQ